MGRWVIAGVALLLLATGYAAQNRIVGQVQSRNGAGLPGCQLDFYYGNQGQLTYRAYTDEGGNFFLDGPQPGPYTVTVFQGGRSHNFKVNIDQSTLSPNVLQVPW
jgi:Carboxypeptidase regulatory-like domain